jgi:hypothetical protein
VLGSRVTHNGKFGCIVDIDASSSENPIYTINLDSGSNITGNKSNTLFSKNTSRNCNSNSSSSSSSASSSANNETWNEAEFNSNFDPNYFKKRSLNAKLIRNAPEFDPDFNASSASAASANNNINNNDNNGNNGNVAPPYEIESFSASPNMLNNFQKQIRNKKLSKIFNPDGSMKSESLSQVFNPDGSVKVELMDPAMKAAINKSVGKGPSRKSRKASRKSRNLRKSRKYNRR